MAQYFTDFSEYTTDQPPSDWTVRWNTSGSTWAVREVDDATGGKVLELTSSSSQRRLITWDLVGTSGTVEVLTRVRLSAIASNMTGPSAAIRAGGGYGSEDAYQSQLVNASSTTSYLRLTRFASGEGTNLATYTDYKPQVGVWTWIRLRAEGNSIQTKVWEEPDEEPSEWHIEVIDDIHSEGWVGLSAYHHGSDYEFDLIGVGTDGDSAPTDDTPAENQPPTADAGTDQIEVIGNRVDLDGTGSSDPETDPLTYSWNFVSVPEGSAAVLINATTSTPHFFPDVAGEYVVQLVVNDGEFDSEPDTVTVTAQPMENRIYATIVTYVYAQNRVDIILERPSYAENFVNILLVTWPPHNNFVETRIINPVRADNLVETIIAVRRFRDAYKPADSVWRPAREGKPTTWRSDPRMEPKPSNWRRIL